MLFNVSAEPQRARPPSRCRDPTDDPFYDAQRKRLYVSGGEGFIDVIQDHGGYQFSRVAHMATAAGARTSLYVTDQSRLNLAVPHRGDQKAEIRVFEEH